MKLVFNRSDICTRQNVLSKIFDVKLAVIFVTTKIVFINTDYAVTNAIYLTQ